MTSTRPLKIGVLGCANIAIRSIIPAIKELENDFELIAVASRSVEKASKVAKDFECKPYFSYDALINDQNIEAVYIPLPSGVQYPWILKALAAGKHVYAEKSFCLTLEQASVACELARNGQLAVFEGYMFLYHRQLVEIVRCLNDPDFGEIRFISTCFGFPPLPPDNFRYDYGIGGGAIKDAAGYPVRLIRCLLGDTVELKTATVRRSPKGSSLWGSGYFAAPNGVAAAVAFGFDNHYRCSLNVWGSKATLTADRVFTAGPNVDTVIRLDFQNGQEQVISVGVDNHFVNALSLFRQSVYDESERQQQNAFIVRQATDLQNLERLSR